MCFERFISMASGRFVESHFFVCVRGMGFAMRPRQYSLYNERVLHAHLGRDICKPEGLYFWD